MKKLFLFTAVILASCSAFAQHAVGSFSIKPEVGMTITNFTGDDVKGANYKVGLVAGAELEYQANQWLGISGGLLYSMQGSKFDDGNTSVGTIGLINHKINLEYINVPVLMNLYVAKGLAFKTGIQVGFLTSAKEKGELNAGVAKTNYDESIKDNCNTTDFAIPVGLSYEYSNFVFDARYNFGLTKVYDGDAKVNNGGFQLTVGYRFDL